MSDARVDTVLQHVRKLVAAHQLKGLVDQCLLQRFADEGDAAAFEVLVRRHGPMVLRVCRQVLRNAQDAEDVFQATFLVLARKAAGIRKQASVASWLHGVAYRLAMQARKATARQRTREQLAERAARMELPVDMTWQEFSKVFRRSWRDSLTLTVRPWCFVTWRARPRMRRPTSSAGVSALCAEGSKPAENCCTHGSPGAA
jgi:RNA polymerase sigma factor (sigma-70 family)